MHLATSRKLLEALSKANIQQSDSSNLVQYLQRNIYAFSAAKSFTQMQYYRDMMVEDGKIIGVGSFVKKIADTGEIFNRKYLEAEYENAHYSAIMAEQWDRYGENDLLQYSTVGDSNVRPSHAVLDKHTAPKSDLFWKFNYPPNGWGCRCSAIPGNANHVNKLTDNEAGRQLKDENRDTPFYNNVGLSKVIFKDNHPYFVNSKGKETNLSWEQYGMRSLDKIRVNQLPEYKKTTMEDYLSWWANNANTSGDIIIKDVLGNEIKLESFSQGKKGRKDDYFKDHLIRKTSDRRHEYATEVSTVLSNPDEVWMNPKDSETKVYLKYYETGTLKLVVNKNNIAETMYMIEKGDKSEANKLGEARKGILYHK